MLNPSSIITQGFRSEYEYDAYRKVSNRTAGRVGSGMGQLNGF